MRLPEPESFEWDKGNIDKNLIKHKVSNLEAEEIFFDKNKIQSKDKLHSVIEKRYLIIGKTLKERLLIAVYTIRNNKIRIISIRDINKKEKTFYEKNA